jgi:hypothetical protein
MSQQKKKKKKKIIKKKRREAFGAKSGFEPMSTLGKPNPTILSSPLADPTTPSPSPSAFSQLANIQRS